ncbi:tripartite motif-containing protein 3 [Lingula anatina]|uniref:Tripartite motif-containing protein 3 n=1 Tax=Lingula anatina TaxID=7574 RepID=A0A1S3KIP5_LINAN|nr:tripartite motif-containing protein 3 [Lingula anatina]XP_013422077.1 tripartite motif-containing protein 3 [Lingula anatina]XP_013422078.1 tripartite motif-containing protein 3 [Lingula anatina]XP_013422079.1 tripartite motif-containing protein 3 [Lingula anatina]|eukprot:XP_013422076.1 tripartite motif-containing protein 3 [Lingula anatina]
MAMSGDSGSPELAAPDLTRSKNWQPAVMLKKFGRYGKENGCLRYPSGISVADNGLIYVADNRLNKVLIYDIEGSYISSFNCSGAASVTALRDGNLAIASYTGSTWLSDSCGLHVFTPDGQCVQAFKNVPAATSVAVNANHEYIIVDPVEQCISVINSHGDIVRQFNRTGRGEAKLPFALTVNSRNEIVVSDTSNNCVKVFNNLGVCLNQFGQKGKSQHMTMAIAPDGSVIRFNKPKGICVDSTDNIYVADSKNGRIQMFTPDGQHQRSILMSSPKFFRKTVAPEAVAMAPTGELLVSCVGDFTEIRVYAL